MSKIDDMKNFYIIYFLFTIFINLWQPVFGIYLEQLGRGIQDFTYLMLLSYGASILTCIFQKQLHSSMKMAIYVSIISCLCFGFQWVSLGKVLQGVALSMNLGSSLKQVKDYHQVMLYGFFQIAGLSLGYFIGGQLGNPTIVLITQLIGFSLLLFFKMPACNTLHKTSNKQISFLASVFFSSLGYYFMEHYMIYYDAGQKIGNFKLLLALLALFSTSLLMHFKIKQYYCFFLLSILGIGLSYINVQAGMLIFYISSLFYLPLLQYHNEDAYRFHLVRFASMAGGTMLLYWLNGSMNLEAILFFFLIAFYFAFRFHFFDK